MFQETTMSWFHPGRRRFKVFCHPLKSSHTHQNLLDALTPLDPNWSLFTSGCRIPESPWPYQHQPFKYQYHQVSTHGYVNDASLGGNQHKTAERIPVLLRVSCSFYCQYHGPNSTWTMKVRLLLTYSAARWLSTPVVSSLWLWGKQQTQSHFDVCRWSWHSMAQQGAAVQRQARQAFWFFCPVRQITLSLAWQRHAGHSHSLPQAGSGVHQSHTFVLRCFELRVKWSNG